MTAFRRWRRASMKKAALLVAVALTMACSTSSQPLTSTEAKSPPARGYHNLISLGPSPGVLLFGGDTAPPRVGHVLGDVWQWRSDQGWTEKTGIGQKDGYAFYERNAQRVVVLVFETGGPCGAPGTSSVCSTPRAFAPLLENWTYYPAKDSWTQRDTDQRPDFQNGSAAAFDTESGRLIVFGGETWAYDPAVNSWAKMAPKRQPDFGAYAVLAYAAKQDRVILLGGEDRGDLSDIWMYDFNHDTWTEAHATPGPTARMYATAAYDARANRLILFGGLGSGGALSDTWSYDLNTNAWLELKPKTSPSGRARHAMAYESETGNVVMFGGGDDPFHFKNDTWIYDPATNNWSEA